MADFIARLKQRKLVQWALAYIAGAWAVLQVLDLAAQNYAWPHLVMHLAFGLVALGLLLTLVLAWYHGERGVQRVTGMELLIVALLLAIGGTLIWRFTPHAAGAVSDSAASHAQASTPHAAASVALPTAVIPAKSIAVLPFANDSGDNSEQFFSDGLSRDLITALSRLTGLKVINSASSFKFRGSQDGVASIARRLGVAYLLQGGVARLGNEVRIRAELVHAADGSTVWSQHYDRPYKSLFKLQDDITHAVAEALKARLLAVPGGAISGDRPPSGNLDAYNTYLKGRAQPFSEAGLRRAIALFQQASRIDPKYASAYAQESLDWNYLGTIFLGSADSRAAIGRAREAAATALRLAPDLPATRLAQVSLLLNVDLDWQDAMNQARLLVKLAPGKASNLNLLAQTLLALGHARQAEQVARRAIAIDPLTAHRYVTLSLTLRAQGRLDASAAVMRKAIDMAPSDGVLHASLTIVRILQGDATAALAAARAERSGAWRDYAMAAALQLGPDRKAATDALQRLIDRHADSSAYQIAQVYAIRRQPTPMFHWLDRAWTNRDAGLFMLLTDPLILRYKDDPRFAAFCRKVGLPAPGASDHGAASPRTPGASASASGGSIGPASSSSG